MAPMFLTDLDLFTDNLWLVSQLLNTQGFFNFKKFWCIHLLISAIHLSSVATASVLFAASKAIHCRVSSVYKHYATSLSLQIFPRGVWYVGKPNGLITRPWGITVFKECFWDAAPSTWTNCDLPVKQDCSHSRPDPVIPITCSNLWSSYWLIVSNAADKSSRQSKTHVLSSTAQGMCYMHKAGLLYSCTVLPW